MSSKQGNLLNESLVLGMVTGLVSFGYILGFHVADLNNSIIYGILIGLLAWFISSLVL